MSTYLAHDGDILNAGTEALVNPVNTMGVMGKGLALQFRRAFPDNYRAYRQACDRGEIRPGRMFVFDNGAGKSPRWIINFPTKRHWRSPSRISDITTGLGDLRAVLDAKGICSVAVPALGCGLGGLAWSDVRPLIEGTAAGLDCEVHMFAPQDLS